MIYQTKQQRANTLDALHNMMPSIPEENISRGLGIWSDASHKDNNCGTLACFGGWCAVWPNFVAQGIKKGKGGQPTLDGTGISTFSFRVSQKLFGTHIMFLTAGAVPYDEGFVGTDHALIMHRLQCLLDNSKVVK